MAFTPNDLQLAILNVVADLGVRANRNDLYDGNPIHPETIPDLLVLAEIQSSDNELADSTVLGSIAELATRGYLIREFTSWEWWPQMGYVHPDRREFIVAYDTEMADLPAVLVNGVVQAGELTLMQLSVGPGHPGGFHDLKITIEGLALLDTGCDPSPASQPTQPEWPPSGYVGTKDIQNLPEYKKAGINPSSSTIQRWIQRDNKEAAKTGNDPIQIVKAIDSGENSYPIEWIWQQIERWKPHKS